MQIGHLFKQPYFYLAALYVAIALPHIAVATPTKKKSAKPIVFAQIKDKTLLKSTT